MLAIFVLSVAFVAVPAYSLAAPAPTNGGLISGDYCSNGGSGSAVCSGAKQTSNPIFGKDGIMLKITNLIALVAGIVAVIMIIISGYQFIASAGDANAVATARRNLIYAVVGLVVIALAETIVRFVASKTG